jgi:O-antigen/teichoic acid export membrane protein
VLHALTNLIRSRLPSDESQLLASGSLVALGLRVAGSAATLGVQLLVIWSVGPETFGDYVYVLSWISVISLIATLGIDTAALRFVPIYQAAGENGLLLGYVRWAAGWTAVASCGLAALLVGVVAALGDLLPDRLAETFYTSALLLPVLVLLLVASGVMRGFKRIALAMAPQWVLRPLLIAFGFGLLLQAIVRLPSAAEVMLVDAGATLLALVVVTAVSLRHLVASGVFAARPIYRSRVWFATASPLIVQTTIRLCMSRVDILLAGAFLGTTQAGIYVVVSQLAALIGFGLLAVNMIAAPLYAGVHSQGRTEELQALVRLATRAVVAFALLIGGALVVLGPWLLGLYGESFRTAGYVALVVLVISQILNSAAGSVGYLMSMTGHEREAAWVTSACGLLNVVLGVSLIPVLGLVGAALSTTITNLVWNGILVWRVRRNLGLHATVLG